MVAATLKIKLKRYTKRVRTLRLDLNKLKDPTVRRKYQNELKKLLPNEAQEENYDQYWTKLKSAMQEAAEKSIDKPQTRRSAWISAETLQLVKKRSRCRSKQTLATLRKEIKKAVRRDKARYYEALADLESSKNGLNTLNAS
ncbi:uncharacterized protein LOC134854793 [Symsagittifera roscoffensis]|uniref:uncharacterized protein LOC134854793 n=1 Tax=Symsagittifera roscoffensis TaxID=84072 RepID=UPI00307B9E3E